MGKALNPERRITFWDVFKQFLVVILSFILGGIFSLIAATCVGVYCVMRVPVSSYIQMATGDENYANYLQAEYAEKSVFQLLGNVLSLTQSAENGTLTVQEVMDISPVVKNAVSDFAQLLANDYGLDVGFNSVDGFCAKSVLELPEYLSGKLFSTQLGDILSAPAVNMLTEENPNYELLKALCYGEEGALTIGDITGGRINDAFNRIPLAPILGINADSNQLLLSIVYGDGYTVEEDGEGNKTLVLAEGTSSKTVADLVNSNMEDLIGGIAIADVLSVQADSDPLLIAIAYGKEGTDYTIVDGKIVLAEGAQPATFGSLFGGSGMSDIINGLPLDKLLHVDANTNPLMLSIVYGDRYEIVEDGEGNKSLILLPDASAKTVGDLTGSSINDLIGGIGIGDMLGLTAASNSVLLALAYGVEGVDYTVVDGKIVMAEGKSQSTLNDLLDGERSAELINSIPLDTLLKVDATSDALVLTLVYGANNYSVNGSTLEHGNSRTVGDLTGGTIDGLIGEAHFGEILKLDGGSDKVLIALAYGAEGEDYTVVDGKIVVLNPENALTISDLMTNGEIENAVNRIPLTCVFSPTAETDPVILCLIYGNEGYEIVDGELIVHEGAHIRTFGELATSPDAALAEMRNVKLSALLELTEESPDFLKAIQHYSLNELSQREILMGLTVRQLFGETEDAFIGAISEYTLEQLTDGTATATLTLGNIIGYDAAAENSAVIDIIQAWTVGDLTGGAQAKFDELLDQLTIGDIVGNTEGSVLLTAFAPYTVKQLSEASTLQAVKLGTLIGYDESTENSTVIEKIQAWSLYDLTNGAQAKFDELLNELTISDIVGNGTSPLMSAIGSWKVSDLQDEEKITNLKIADFITIDENSSRLLKTIKEKNWTLSTLTDESALEGLKISELIGIESGSTGLISAIADYTLAEISDGTALDSISIGQFIEVDPANTVLAAIADTPINDLSNTFENLTVRDIFPDTENNILNALQDSKINEMDTAIANLTVEAVFEDAREHRGVWIYMLDDGEESHKISEFEKLTANFTQNIQTASINALVNNGVIDGESVDGTMRNQDITYFGDMERYYDEEGNEKNKVGQLTIAELLRYTVALIAKANEMSAYFG